MTRLIPMFLVLLGFGSFADSEYGCGTQPHLTPKSAEYGTVTRGEVISGELSIVNAGPTSWKLVDVKNTCGCIVVTWISGAIRAGETFKLSYAIDTQNERSGKVSAFVGLQLQQNQQQILLTHEIIYTVLPCPHELRSGLTITPQRFKFELFPDSRSSEIRLLKIIVPRGQTSLQASASAPWITFGTPYQVHRLIIMPVHFDFSGISNNRTDLITLGTTHFKDHAQVLVTLREDLSPIAGTCSLGPVRPGATIEHQLQFTKSSSVNIVDVRTDVPGLSVNDKVAFSDNRIIIYLRYAPGREAGVIGSVPVKQIGILAVEYENDATQERGIVTVPVQSFW